MKKQRAKMAILFVLAMVLAGGAAANPGTLRKASGDTIIYLPLPQRSDSAPGGMEVAASITPLSLDDREKIVVKEILSGNVPSFSRKMRAIQIVQKIGGKQDTCRIFVACDYLAIGSDSDYLYMPMTPSTAQYLANRLKCTLPTKKLVDVIYRHADLKLRPQPIPPSNKMTTVPVFVQHTDSIRQQMAQLGFDRSSDALIAGHKKDIIISNKIYSLDRNYPRVVIYGWHLSENHPIQPVYNGHSARYADYSHGVRLIATTGFLNGDSCSVRSVLQNRTLCVLLSDEGIILKPYYPVGNLFSSVETGVRNLPTGIELSQNYPNPFNPTTTIDYWLSHTTQVNLSVFNVLGKKVATLISARQSAGKHWVKWDAEQFPGGVYWYRLKAGGFEQRRQMVFLP